MKALSLTMLAVGAPLLLMLLLTSRSAPGPALPPPAPAPPHSARPHPPARPVPATPTEIVPSTEIIEPVRLATRASPGPSITEAIDEWLAARREAGSASASSATAEQSLARGDYERAAAAFDRLLVRRPDEPDLLLGKALSLAGLERYEDALPLFEQVVERQPRNITALFNCGLTLMRLEASTPASLHRDQALDLFQRLLQIEPGHVRAQFNRSVLLQAAGRNLAAIAAWRELTEPAKPHPAPLPETLEHDAWFHRGELALAMAQLDEAERCFQRVTQLRPKDAGGWCNLGIARAALGRHETAVSALEQAVRLDPAMVPAINQLAYAHAAIYRAGGDEASRSAVIDLCDRSLAVRSYQPNIRALRHAARYPGATAPAEASPDQP